MTVVANGAGDVISIKISKEVVDPEDVEMLEDLILTGVKKAIEEGKALAQAEMGKVTSGMGLPPRAWLLTSPSRFRTTAPRDKLGALFCPLSSPD